MLLGIDENNSRLYEGSKNSGCPIASNIVFQRLLPLDNNFSQLQCFPDDKHYSNSYALRELSFDPISRIKRGILYSGSFATQPQDWQVLTSNQTREHLRLLTFQTCGASAAFDDINTQNQTWCALGEKGRFTIGNLISVERLIDKSELLTFRMRSQFGLLPSLNNQQLNSEDFHKLNTYLEKVLEGAHSSPPESVIDRCREAAACALSIKLGEAGRDLAKLIKAYQQKEPKAVVANSSAEIINRLHSRGKHSMKSDSAINIPLITDKDAELAVVCLGTILRDLGYASWG